MYKLIFDEQQQVVGYTLIQEQQEGDVVFLAQDLPYVKEYLQPRRLEELKQMQDIQDWLQANDYKVNKFLLGEYAADDERWVNYLHDRQIKLDTYNSLEELVTQEVKEPFDISLLTPIPEPEQIVEEVVEEINPLEDNPNGTITPFEDGEEVPVNEDEGTIGEGTGTDDTTTTEDTTDTEPINEEV